jgi:hypothetical protein
MNSPWVPVNERMPPDHDKVDVWFNVWASPMSFGMADSWCEPEAWRESEKWFHINKYEIGRGEKLELESRYISHWKPVGATDIEGPDSIIWKASALAGVRRLP